MGPLRAIGEFLRERFCCFGRGALNAVLSDWCINADGSSGSRALFPCSMLPRLRPGAFAAAALPRRHVILAS